MKLKIRLRISAVLLAAGFFAAPVSANDVTEPASGLYAALGGPAGVQHLADDLVGMATQDARISASFQDVDLPHLRRMLAEQFCAISGGPCRYTGKDMKVIHEDLGITHAQFNALAEDLQIVMERRGISSAASNQLIARLAPMFREVVTK